MDKNDPIIQNRIRHDTIQHSDVVILSWGDPNVHMILKGEALLRQSVERNENITARMAVVAVADEAEANALADQYGEKDSRH